MKKNNKKGFTLIELVIVILIIAILAVVLIPQLSSMSNKAKNTGVQSAFREFQTAAQSVLLVANQFDSRTGDAYITADERTAYGIPAVMALNNYLDKQNEIRLISSDNVTADTEAGKSGIFGANPKVYTGSEDGTNLLKDGTLKYSMIYASSTIGGDYAGTFPTTPVAGNGVANGAYTTINRLDPWGTPYLVSFGYSVYNTQSEANTIAKAAGSGTNAKVPSYSLVEFRSAGPDQNFNTRDDLLTWVQWEDGSAGTYQYGLEGGNTWDINDKTKVANNASNVRASVTMGASGGSGSGGTGG